MSCKMETREAKKEEKNKRNTHSYRKHGLVSKFKVNTYKVTVNDVHFAW